MLASLISLAVACSRDNGQDADQASPISSPGDATSAPISSTARSLPPATGTSNPAPTPIESPTPVSTVTPQGGTATSVHTPAPLPPDAELDLASLNVPVCLPATSSSPGNGFGTIPHATPTPIPAAGSSGTPASLETQQFVVALKAVIISIVGVTVAADDAWGSASGPSEMAGSVLFEGRRLSLLCAALALVPLTTEGVEFIETVADALTTRSDLLSEIADLLRSGEIPPGGLDNQRQESSEVIVRLRQDLDDFAASRGVLEAGPSPFTAVNTLLELTVNAPAGWLITRNGFDIVLIAPTERQVFSVRGLGPDAWKLGTAVRVRRFRNSPPVALAESASTLDTLYVRYGDRVTDLPSKVADTDAVQRIYHDEDGGWDTHVAAAVVGDATYLFEFGCPATSRADCTTELVQFLATVRFTVG
jgi:hypothetical protein